MLVDLCVSAVHFLNITMVCFADLGRFEQALRLDDKCFVFEFEVHNKVHVQSFLSSIASIYGIGGFVRRTSKTCVKCKVVTTLGNDDNFTSFLEETRDRFTSSLVRLTGPDVSTNEQDIEVAFSKKFVVHQVPQALPVEKSAHDYENGACDGYATNEFAGRGGGRGRGRGGLLYSGGRGGRGGRGRGFLA